ncbi:hypothetical protein ACFV1L_16590 [Kitasatospora sp. NPDC059646]|uniref:hypothetical protein n=1 Tax=Kitasatospora sp. NPDC059646 TaxID=3346893 RepID=UPI0036C682DE
MTITKIPAVTATTDSHSTTGERLTAPVVPECEAVVLVDAIVSVLCLGFPVPAQSTNAPRRKLAPFRHHRRG